MSRPAVGSLVASLLVLSSPGTIWTQAEECNWSYGLGSAGGEGGSAVDIGPSGEIAFAGNSTGSIDLGGGSLVGQGSTDGLVAKFQANGTHIWSKRFGDAEHQTASSVAIGDDGSIVVGGSARGSVDFGGGLLSCKGGADAFVAQFDASGSYVWGGVFGDDTLQYGNDVAIGPSGNVALVGHFRGTLDFGGERLSSSGQDDAFVAVFSPMGAHLWSSAFGDTEGQSVNSVAFDLSGDLLITGSFRGSIDFGAGSMTSVGNQSSTFVAKFSGDGTPLWSQKLSSTGGSSGGESITSDSGRNCVVAGKAIRPPGLPDGALLFLVKYDPSGTLEWSRSFPAGIEDVITSVTTDAHSDVVILGAVGSPIDLGGGSLTPHGIAKDVLLAKFDPSGVHRWSRFFGDLQNQAGWGAAVDANGCIVITGAFEGGIDFGSGALRSAGDFDVLLAKLAPNPTPVNQETWTSTKHRYR